MRSVRLSDAARYDVREIAAYLQQESLGMSVVRRFLVSFEETCLLLQKHPEIGGSIVDLRFELKGMRRIVIRRFQNYLIFYRVSESSIRVIRVLHGAQDVYAILSMEAQHN